MEPLNRRKFVKYAASGSLGLTLTNVNLSAHAKSSNSIPIGIIGMDTSHSVAFTKYINGQDNGFQVVAAFTTVSKDIPASYERVDKFTQQLRDEGIKIVNSIKEILDVSECILLETNDGRLHLDQSEQVFKSGKRVFLDKPVAAGLTDVVKIYQLSKTLSAPTFSTSGTRFMSVPQQVRSGSIGKVMGADTYSPIKYDPTHSDLYWYGIHGVELLFTVMKTGCLRVRRVQSPTHDTVVGEWTDGRIGTFRGIREGKQGYGGQAFGTEGLTDLGEWEGYEPMVDKVLHYFKTGEIPVEPAETLEIYAFMEAAQVSSEQNGEWVDLDTVLKEAGH